jgi:hypothetical protein
MADPIWSANDADVALKEGWMISEARYNAMHAELQLQCLDVPDDAPDDSPEPRFESDEGAWKHVLTQAALGSGFHKRALAYVKLHNPQEHELILTAVRLLPYQLKALANA